MPQTKPWWKSKTIAFNAIVAALGALELNARLIQPYVPGNVYGWGVLILTVGNVVLRSITAAGVSLK